MSRRSDEVRALETEIAAALVTAPGPSPWYLRVPNAGVPSTRGRLVWRDVGEDGAHAGKMLLIAPDGTALLLVDFYVRVQPLEDSRFLLWRQRKAGPGSTPYFAPNVDLEVFDADRLAPLASVEVACATLVAGTHGWIANAAPLARLELPAGALPGRHSCAIPAELASCEEIFVLADGSAPASARPDIRVLILRPRHGSYEVVPQDWFNEGDLDFGYQWITRIARDPASGKLVGDGIRLGPFRLDESGRQTESRSASTGLAASTPFLGRGRTIASGAMTTAIGALGFFTIADDWRHRDEVAGVGAILVGGLATLVLGLWPSLEKRFPLGWFALGLVLGGVLGLATNQMLIVLPLTVIVSLGIAWSRSR